MSLKRNAMFASKYCEPWAISPEPMWFTLSQLSLKGHFSGDV